MKKQAGFTLIELIVVIVILGILAVSALPRFVGVDTEARTAAAAGVAAAMSSASSINYGARSANSTRGVTLSAAAGTICTTANAAWGNTATGLLQGGFPPATQFTLAALASSTATCGANGYVECSVTPVGGGTAATATVSCIN